MRRKQGNEERRGQLTQREGLVDNAAIPEVFTGMVAIIEDLFQDSAGDHGAPDHAEPFLKWAGGKTQLLSQLAVFFPLKFAKYHEPFVGSGAVFFALWGSRGYFEGFLHDANAQLINCFAMVKDQVAELIPLIREHRAKHSKEHFYRVRRTNPDSLTPVQAAARMIYLNKTCYNGLYRVNSKGQFNVPMGSYTNPRLYSEKELRAASLALQNTVLIVGDFSDVLDDATSGDFVYFDPPYYSEERGFTAYAVAANGKAGFGAEEHYRLAEVAKDLHGRGCHVVLSNSDTDFIRRLYGRIDGFQIHVVKARRAINSKGAGRGPISELVITNK